ncbi:MAG: hypothetical protein K1V99_01290 [Bacteroidales bacterium]|nr:hypothetical protein [Bacteroidales bacterium]
MKKIIMILTVALLAASCDKYDVTEVLLQRSDISLTWKGKLQMSYNESSCQLGFNEEKKEFRVYDDALGYWFIVRCNQMPRHVDQTLKADVEWTTANDTRTEKGVEFSVEKTDSQGKIWMWSKSKKIGVVIRQL